MLYYKQFTRDYVELELPMIQGFSFLAYAKEQDGWRQFCGMRRASPGYLAQEIKRLLDMCKDGDAKD